MMKTTVARWGLPGLLLLIASITNGAVATGYTVIMSNGNVGSYTDSFSQSLHAALNSRLGRHITFLKVSDKTRIFDHKTIKNYSSREFGKFIKSQAVAVGGNRLREVIENNDEVFRRANFVVIVQETGADNQMHGVRPVIRQWLSNEGKRVSVVLIEDTFQLNKSGKIAGNSDVKNWFSGISGSRFLVFKPPPPKLNGGAPSQLAVNLSVCWSIPAMLRPKFKCGRGGKIYKLGISIDNAIGMSSDLRNSLMQRISPTITISGKPITLHTKVVPTISNSGLNPGEGRGQFDFHFVVKRSAQGAVYHRPMIRYLGDRRQRKVKPRGMLSGYEELSRWIEKQVTAAVRRRVAENVAPKLVERLMKIKDNRQIPVPDNTLVELESHFGGPGWTKITEQRSSSGLVRLKLPKEALYHRLIMTDNRKRHVAMLGPEIVNRPGTVQVAAQNIKFHRIIFSGSGEGSSSMKGNGSKVFMFDDLDNLVFSKSIKEAGLVYILKKKHSWYLVPDDPEFETALGALEVDEMQDRVVAEFKKDPLAKRKNWSNLRGYFSGARLNARGTDALMLSANFIAALVTHTSNEFRNRGNIQLVTRSRWEKIAQKMDSEAGAYERLERALWQARFGSKGEPLSVTQKRFRLFLRRLQMNEQEAKNKLSRREQGILRFWASSARRLSSGSPLISKQFGQFIVGR